MKECRKTHAATDICFQCSASSQIAVLVNKMDLVDYDKNVYDSIVKEYTGFLKDIDVIPNSFIPVSGMEGDNIASMNGKMSWYDGSTVLNILDQFTKEKPDYDKPFRMPVQDVYKFTANSDSRRIVAGTVESGTLKTGDTVVFYPSGKKSRVKIDRKLQHRKKDRDQHKSGCRIHAGRADIPYPGRNCSKRKRTKAAGREKAES